MSNCWLNGLKELVYENKIFSHVLIQNLNVSYTHLQCIIICFKAISEPCRVYFIYSWNIHYFFMKMDGQQNCHQIYLRF